ncbi:xanthine dehydrogenase accessory protein XdhC [Hahella sp. CCB-MM4]|uniref:xanthine dehydrogenase accessory protein XdhC n=1 Tax=Hahella sp. (strain CCB-MM4) TaxID=1926491 RepID=UPI000B9B207C|nr:xanthine dehydrogenase accessory protein XdhC [Hahella sp. CCB-MM4]OZG73947.1 xanthine dehydrogenase accessory protein XdhC [Hahella sp. CCB-MM4]
MRATNWIDAAKVMQQRGEPYVLVTLLGCTGSTPRDQGSKMVVSAEKSYDTIGGGQLEFSVIQKSRELMTGTEATQVIQHFPLAAALAQCCGGSATVLLEYIPGCRFRVALYGAGHVAKSLVTILGGLPCKVSWFDERSDQFPQTYPDNVTPMISMAPVASVKDLPIGSDMLILTHNHQLDFELCKAALDHGGLRHIGLIGSETKAERFAMRLDKAGYSQEQIERIVCPVGSLDVPGKLPMEVAVSIAAQLIAIENAGAETPVRRGLSWNHLKNQLGTQPGARQKGLAVTLSKDF